MGTPHVYSTEIERNGMVLVRFKETKSKNPKKLSPISKIKYVLLNLESFTYASSLDLNTGYYHIELSPGAKQICTILLPWG